MTLELDHIKLIRRSLFVAFVGFVAFVAYHFSQGFATQPGRGVSVEEPDSPVSREVEIEQLDADGRRAWVLKAAESTGRTSRSQSFRDVEIHFDAGEDEVPVVVTAKDCEVDDEREVRLSGDVVVVAEGGLRLTSETLQFNRYPDTVFSPDAVRYQKPGLEGSSGAMRYVIRHGELDLMDGVDMTFRAESGAPVRIRSKSALMRRKQDFVRFVDDVRVRQETKSLRANDLQLYLTEDESQVEHMEAYENVDLRWDVPPESEPDNVPSEPSKIHAEDTPFPVPLEAPKESISIARSSGRKRLVTNHLEVIFREDGQTLSRARALDGGTLYLFAPENESSGYDKTLEGNLLAFDFDEEGRLTTLRGRGGVELVLTPVTGSDDERESGRRVVTARQLEADFHAASGDLIEARCSRSVEFEQAGGRASAEEGVFVAETSRLILTESPKLWDESVRVEAQVIRIDTVSGDVEAERDVRSASEDSASGGPSLFPGGKQGPVYFVADHLEYDRDEDLATYTGAARGFQGPNRVEAEEIRIVQQRGELVAERDVRTVFVQGGPAKPDTDDSASENASDDSKRSRRGSKAFSSAVTRAGEMIYRRDSRRIEYRGDAEMRSADMTLRGDGIDVVLLEDGDDLEEVVATGNVDVRTSEGNATGERARYLPDEESFTVSGPLATFESDGKVIEAKQLTFFLGDDRILVDGREESRTTTKYSSRPRPF